MGAKIYVGNLSFNTDDQGLEDAFSKYGSVVSAKVITDRDSGRSRGFGFVEMSNSDEAQEAISSLNETDLDGRNIRVNEAEDKPKRDFGGGGGGGRRY